MADSPSSEENLYCKGCNRVFNTQRELEVHTLTCTLPVRGASFFQWADLQGIFPERRKEQQDDGEKIALPSSQPGSQNSTGNEEEIEHKCHLCSRTFGSDRGLQQHIRKCSKKKNQKQMQTHTSESSQALGPPERPEIPPQVEAEPNQIPTQEPQDETWEGHTYPDL